MPISLIRAEREKRDLSLADLAAQVGMSPSMLSRLERGQRRLKVQDVLVLALALGCKPSARET